VLSAAISSFVVIAAAAVPTAAIVKMRTRRSYAAVYLFAGAHRESARV